MPRQSPYRHAMILALLAAASSLCSLQAADVPDASTSMATLPQSIERLEAQRQELLAQLKALDAPIP